MLLSLLLLAAAPIAVADLPLRVMAPASQQERHQGDWSSWQALPGSNDFQGRSCTVTCHDEEARYRTIYEIRNTSAGPQKAVVRFLLQDGRTRTEVLQFWGGQSLSFNFVACRLDSVTVTPAP